MNKHTIDVLEFDKIIEGIKENCFTDRGKQLLLNYNFFSTKQEIEKEFDKIEEIFNCYQKNMYINFVSLSGIEEILNKLKNTGFINIEEILIIKKVLIFHENLKQFFNINRSEFPYFANQFNFTINFNEFIKILDNSISENSEMLDSASHELKSIRKNIRFYSNKIFQKLEYFTKSKKYADILTDNNYVIKEGKYLLPIKPHKKKDIDGIVQHISSTGKTVFVEPFDIIEINNKILLERAKENEEIYKILKNISDYIFKNIDYLKKFLNFFYQLDLYNAKAKYFYKNKYTRPIINSEKRIKLFDFFHPFLKNPVKNDIEINNETPILIISGPNAGGKTVTLKAIGLIVLLAKSGFYVPASNNSTIPLINNIFVDIGDEQSIDNSLSTFSSHINNLKTITEFANEDDLVIIDEIGTGTSPEEGEALSCAIIEHLVKIKCISLISSHYTKVKLLSNIFKEIKNSSMQFQINTLSPLYKLIQNIPGASYAFYISKKLGLNKDIIENAKKYISHNKNVDDMVIELQEKLLELENEKQKLFEKEEEINKLKNEYEILIKRYNKNRDEIKKELNEKIYDEISSLKKIVERRIHLLKKQGYDLNKSKELMEIINIKKNKLENDINYDILPEENKINNNFKVGDKVFVKSIKKNGKIIEIKKNRVKVSLGNITLDIDPKFLEKLDNDKDNIKTYSVYANSISKKISSNVDIRGKTISDAKNVLEEYFDSIVFTNFEKIYIIHGKGEGKLQEFVHQYLKDNPFVKKYEFALPEEGGTGCTVVYLKL